MAITRLKDIIEIKTFEYRGAKLGLRLPLTSEMQIIVNERSRYIKTMRDEYAQNKADNIFVEELAPEGDVGILLALQQMVSQMLVVDPENPSEPWFAKSKEDQAYQNRQKELASEWPAEFHAIVYEVFNEATQPKSNKDNSEGGDVPLERAPKTDNALPEQTMERESSATSSPSQSTSEVSTQS